MRNSEWIQAGFAAILALVAWIRPLEPARRKAITIFAVAAIAVVALARLSVYVLGPEASSILRDWLPVPLTLIPYWQTGQFFKGPDEKTQSWLVASDRAILGFFARSGFRFGPIARLTMEWAYALCYGLAFFGLVVLYAAGLRRETDVYWTLVLIPTYLCYAATPFFPALPPRSLRTEPARTQTTKSRVFNLWLLKYGSIQAISFPSAHAACAMAISLVLLRDLPIAGLVCLVISFWISVAAVVGGYHYAIDVILGAALALVFYLAWQHLAVPAHLIPSTLITAPAMAFVTPL
jgi:membrane-associated phospholipid phosphatase